MKLGRRGEYGLRAMLYLVEHQGTELVQGHRIAKHERIPEKFLEQILLDLKKAGLLESQAGSRGGYRLARSASAIAVGDVVRAIEGPLAPFLDERGLRRRLERETGHVGLYSVLLDVRNAIASVLDRTSLAEVAERTRRIRDARGRVLTYQI